MPKKVIVAYRWQEDHDVELEGIPFGVVEYEWVLDIKKGFVLRLIQVYPIKCTVMFCIPAIMGGASHYTATAENWRLKLLEVLLG